jgi:hypothetical protein
VIIAVLLQLLDTTRWSLVLARNLGAGLVADGRQLNLLASTLRMIAWRRLVVVVGRAVGRVSLGCGSSSTLLFRFTLVLLFLLALLPFFANLLEFCALHKC